ncbi:type II toxin-antitoxin system HicA family toxin [Saccharibacillus deserti]|uniref:type II toxin-antitoxin system HicA family toxin n=1 Tax=Saccharibacillus deserti TaxID=1634444 RepID=UPI001557EF8D|nr:type II toxin-antitoxin system HicA family toxin [Saccharibacillus deserti]
MKKHKRIAAYAAGAAGLILLLGAVVPAARYGTDTALAMARLTMTNAELVAVNGNDRFNTYLTDDDGVLEEIRSLIESRGWTFEQQDGSGYFFRKDGRQTIVTTQQISRHTTEFQIEKRM